MSFGHLADDAPSQIAPRLNQERVAEDHEFRSGRVLIDDDDDDEGYLDESGFTQEDEYRIFTDSYTQAEFAEVRYWKVRMVRRTLLYSLAPSLPSPSW